MKFLTFIFALTLSYNASALPRCESSMTPKDIRVTIDHLNNAQNDWQDYAMRCWKGFACYTQECSYNRSKECQAKATQIYSFRVDDTIYEINRCKSFLENK